jgi:DNA polymerase I
MEGYTQSAQNVAALKWARDQDRPVHQRQDIEYMIVDDGMSSRNRAALAHEEIDLYDASYCETQLVKAVESVLSLIGWDWTEIRRELTETRVLELTAYANTENN